MFIHPTWAPTYVLPDVLRGASMSAVPANLFEIAAPRRGSNAHRHPPKLSHELGQAPAGAGRAVALLDLQDIEHSLGAEALHPIRVDGAPQSLQPQPPRVYGRRCKLRLC